jgi:DNA-binding response OmpR family regulator
MATRHRDARRILIVERDAQVRSLQQYFLGDAGFAVGFVEDGEAAFENARCEPPALIITEILIPKLDGLALCRRLRDDPLTRDVPILVFTILAARVRAGEAGANAFLRKPLIDSTFLAAVQEVLAAQTSRLMEDQWT